MTALADFLLARIAEDEAMARSAADYDPDTEGGHWFADGGSLGPGREPGWRSYEYLGEEIARHAARWDPARVLAECEAKRRIVEREYRLSRKIRADDQRWLLEAFTNSDGRDCYRITYYDGAVVEMLERSFYEQHSDPLNEISPVLCLLALPYADHPDYREEWRP